MNSISTVYTCCLLILICFLLATAVQAAIDKGLSIDQAKHSSQVPKKFAKTVEEWGEDAFRFNIEGAYKQLKLNMENKLPIAK